MKGAHLKMTSGQFNILYVFVRNIIYECLISGNLFSSPNFGEMTDRQVVIQIKSDAYEPICIGVLKSIHEVFFKFTDSRSYITLKFF